MDAFSKGNEAFVAECYEDAVELYTQAIKEDADKDDYFANRSHAYIKLEKYTEALKDADSALKLNSQNSKACLRKGIAKFHLEDYLAARLVLEEGQKLDSTDKQWSIWLRKCEAELDLAKTQQNGNQTDVQVGVSSLCPKESGEQQASSTSGSSSGQAESPATKENTAPTATIPITPKTKFDWYQTETQVVLTIMLKNVKKEDLRLTIEERALSLAVKLPSGSDYVLDLDLAHEIVTEKTITRVIPSKIEIKLKKKEGFRWGKLEGDPATEESNVKHFNPASSGDLSTHKYPSSAHYTRDWDKVVSEIKKEEKEEKPEGDAALNQLFQQIYSDGTDDVKKAMNKSFAESGGTVLSTNWKDVGNKQVDCKPPDGMEYKKYSQ